MNKLRFILCQTFYGLRNTDLKKLKNVFYQKISKKTFTEFLKQGEIPNLLLSLTGIKEDHVARALCEELGTDYIIINMFR